MNNVKWELKDQNLDMSTQWMGLVKNLFATWRKRTHKRLFDEVCEYCWSFISRIINFSFFPRVSDILSKDRPMYLCNQNFIILYQTILIQSQVNLVMCYHVIFAIENYLDFIAGNATLVLSMLEPTSNR